MSRYEEIQQELRRTPRRWLVTGAAGFIGSNIVKRLLALGQHVTGLDNYSSGHHRNLDQVLAGVGDAGGSFRMIDGDIEQLATCREACAGVDHVVHQAAIGSVPRSMEDPLAVNRTNVDGFVNMLVAARDAGVKRVVYASSCAMYGDVPGFPKREDDEIRALSPYATTKHVNELYAEVFERAFGLGCVGLRYFNVFGPRQDPDGPYAAVIPRWIQCMLAGDPCIIYGTGEQTRDFVFVEDVVQANLLASVVEDAGITGRAYNVGVGERTSLVELFGLIRDAMTTVRPELSAAEPTFETARAGDVPHSCADIGRAREALGFAPAFTVASGLGSAVEWYAQHLAPRGAVLAG